MAGLVIFTVKAIHDRERLDEYKRAAHPTIQAAGGKVIVAYGRTRVIEGDGPVVGMVVTEFPTFEAAEAWWDSDGYAAVRALRKGATEVESVIVETRPGA